MRGDGRTEARTKGGRKVITLMPFHDRLKALRKASGLTQEGLAYKAGLSVSAVAKLERLPMDPAYSTLLKLAGALGVGLDAFQDDPNEAKPAKKPRRKK